jgi:penicillin G amidase
MRWVRRILLTLLLLVLVVGLAGLWTTRRPFPTVEGEVAVAGLDGPVEVLRDVDGVPHIYASTTHDLLFAQGYVHAQDRFWQMDFWRHLSAGRLSELFGASQVETDAFLRTLGFRRIAEVEYTAVSDGLRAALDAYSEGVNAYLAERKGSRLALEYAVLGLQNRGYVPEPWTGVDSLAWGKVMAWDLGANLVNELERAVVAGIVGRERAEQLYPPVPAEHPVIVASAPGPTATGPPPPLPPEAEVLLDRVAARVGSVPRAIGGAGGDVGSNNWVIAGSRTASGAPLLANDPHLGIQMPSIWYQVGLHCVPRGEACPYEVAGFSFPGTAGVVVGHNDRIAWGVTNLGPDTQDLYIERINPDDPDQYEVEGSWVDMEVRSETISVAGGEPVEIVIRSTRHGPVISGRYGAVDELDEVDLDLPEPYAIALRWANLEPSTLFEALLRINRASNWDEFREAAARWDLAAQNLVYADVDGHIGYQATGRTPIRRAWDGRYPVPGWSSEYEWEGFVPFEELPSVLDPDGGFIVTANQPVTDGGYPYLLHVDTSYGFRAARISELIAGAGGPLSVEDLAGIQSDAFDASAEALVPVLLELPATGAVATLQEVLRPWSEGPAPFRMDANSPGAAAYGAVWRHVLGATFDDELPERYAAGGGPTGTWSSSGRYFEVVRTLLDDPDDPWWDDVGTPEREDRDTILAGAMTSALAELEELLGPDPAGWTWGALHVPTFANQSFGSSGIGPIEWLFNRTGPGVSGGSEIVNANGWVPKRGYGVTVVPSMRLVVDLGDLGRSTAIHTTGQSGHPFHPHYDDMIEPWANGETRPLRWTRDQVEADLEARLTLVPAP